MKNLPNILTTTRIIFGLIIPALLIQESFLIRILAFNLFLLTALTDWIDGHLARKNQQTTNFGKIADPIADKVLFLGLFLSFSFADLYSIWWTVPIIAREVLVTVLRLKLLKQKKVVAAEKSGKIKTTVQFLSIVLIFGFFMQREYFSYNALNEIGDRVIYSSLIASIFLTIYSGLEFLIRNRKSLLNKNND